MKKVVIFGGGTGMSTMLRGLKEFPVDIVSVVTVSDDGRSSGILRKEFNTPAVGDIRQVIASLSEKEPLIEKLFNYRFETNSDLNGHAVGNLLLTATTNITGSLGGGIKALSDILNLKGKVLPLTEDNVILMAKMDDNEVVEGEESITLDKRKIKKVFYKETPKVKGIVLKEIKDADLIIFSAGSLYTSIIPHLLCKEVINTLDKTDVPIAYISNIVTQPGETDNFTVYDHVKVLNKYLGKRKIDTVFSNNGEISKDVIEKYKNSEQKDPVILNEKEFKNKKVKIITNDYVTIEDNYLRHDSIKLGLDIFTYLIKK